MPDIRPDIFEVADGAFDAMAQPGAALTGEQRVGLAAAARGEQPAYGLLGFAQQLYNDPGSVTAEVVDTAAEGGFAPVVETVGLMARLSAVDRFHDVMGLDPKPLPTPVSGDPTGNIAEGLKKRRAHVPMPPGPIPVALDLVPAEGEALRAMFGPLYMTEEEMGDPDFARSPGLNTPQLETIAAKISLINRCFY